MRIAIDTMGGDFAPKVIVEGVLRAAADLPKVQEFILVGPKETVTQHIDKLATGSLAAGRDRLGVLHATEIVEMAESPVLAIRRKKDSSISRAVDLVRDGEADAIFSAGNTGAAVAAAKLKLRTLPGITRPAIATLFPSPVTPFLLLDAGANTDCTSQMIAQFGIMGSLYMQEIRGIKSPRVGVLSIGEEDAKGNEASKDAFKLLEKSSLNFIGNVESGDLFEGRVDVAVCDGFVGNMVLKTSEAVAKTMGRWLRDSFTANPLRKFGALCLRGALRDIKRTSDPDNYGGAPLLGAKGIVIIGHGSSSARAVRNAMQVCLDSHELRINEKLSEGVKEINAATSGPESPDNT